METLRGVIERLTYHSQETGYTVAKLTPEDSPQLSLGTTAEVTIVGNIAGINVGEAVELTGHWKVHPEYGKQFQVEQMRSVLPATVAGIEKYLGSGLIKGVGPVTAKRIVRHFGKETLDIIEESPNRLVEVPGVGRKRLQQIIEAWDEQKAIKEVMIFLQSHGVSTSLATKIYKAYGNEAIILVQNDPYRLAREIYGIGFLTADKIARALGIPSDSPQRVAAGIAYTLNQAGEEGHVFLPAPELIENAAQLLAVEPSQIATGLIQLWESDQIKVAREPGGQPQSPPAPVDESLRLVGEAGQLYSAATVDQAQQLLRELQTAPDAASGGGDSTVEPAQAIYLTPFFYSETGVAGRLNRLLHANATRLTHFNRPDFSWDTQLDALESNTGVILAPQQRAAVQTALTHRLTILTGGPGTGKTTTVRTILQLCREAGHRVRLAAPTGRAAKRLGETTGQDARTLHRLLEFQPAEGMRFKRDEDSPLDGDLLIVDEASMLDLALTNHLLKAVPPGMHLLLVGDVDQLPSVGAGNVLRDLIGAVEELHRRGQPPAAAATVIRLQTIFRQAADSAIITNAHRINQGKMPDISNAADSDFFLFKTDDPDRAAQLCVELVQTRIPRRFAIPSGEIQVLSPMHRGRAGVGALNSALQAALNPPDPQRSERLVGNRTYRVGDRVMQLRNNYDKDVYNGDMGVIQAIDLAMQNMTVMMDGRPVTYDFTEVDELTHAYAISVHKSQGSEFPAVVLPILTGHYVMLQRNLLYTAITRARRLVVLVGQSKAIAMAVGNDQVTLRYSGLQQRLLAWDTAGLKYTQS